MKRVVARIGEELKKADRLQRLAIVVTVIGTAWATWNAFSRFHWWTNNCDPRLVAAFHNGSMFQCEFGPLLDGTTAAFAVLYPLQDAAWPLLIAGMLCAALLTVRWVIKGQA